jgi:hypothetical protein
MGDVEEMIGELETSEDEPSDPEETKDAKAKAKKGEEETFGLDLDSAWSSPERSGDK